MAGAGGITGLASSNSTVQADFANVQNGITNKDLAGYKTAATQLVNEKSAVKVDKINAITQGSLNSVSARKTKLRAVQDAIKNNDYIFIPN